MLSLNPAKPITTGMKNLYFLFISLLLLNVVQGCAQSSLGFQTHYGTYLTKSPKADYLKDSYSFFNEIYYQRQTDGSKAWHNANNLPQWGVFFFYGSTGSQRHIGNMAGLAPFINIPIVKTKSFSSKLRAAMGLGWVQKPYDKITNHKNVLIGSHLNGYMGFLWQNEWQLTKRLAFNAGFSFTHLSNGGSTLPNLGLNIPAATVGLRYGTAQSTAPKTFENPFKRARWQYSLYAGGGIKQAPWVESKRYLITTLTGEVGKAYQLGIVSAGAVVHINPSLEVHPLGIPSLKRKGNFLQGGVFGAYEHNLGKLSIPLQLGAYVWNKDLSPQLFQNIGLRYRVAPSWKLQALLKTHMGQADHIQLGVGYTFKR